MFGHREFLDRGTGLVCSLFIQKHSIILSEEPFFQHHLGQFSTSSGLASAFVEMVLGIDDEVLRKMVKLCGGEGLTSQLCGRMETGGSEPELSTKVMSVFSVCQRNAFGGQREPNEECMSLEEGTSQDDSADVPCTDLREPGFNPKQRHKGSFIYESACLFNHSCNPNAQHKVTADGRIFVCARRDIEVGEEITIAYVHIHDAGEVRRAHLRKRYGFECTCTRCIEVKSDLFQSGTLHC